MNAPTISIENTPVRMTADSTRHPLARKLVHNRPVRRHVTRTKAPAFDPSLVSATLSPKF